MTRPMLPRSFTLAFRRERIQEATVDEVAEKGYRNVTVADIVSRAGIARNSFYETFPSKEAAFTAAFEWIVATVLERAEQADNVVDALVDFAVDHPNAARCALIEAPQGIPDVYVANQAAVARQTGLEEPVGEMVVGGVASILYRALQREEPIDREGLREFVSAQFEVPVLAGR